MEKENQAPGKPIEETTPLGSFSKKPTPEELNQFAFEIEKRLVEQRQRLHELSEDIKRAYGNLETIDEGYHDALEETKAIANESASRVAEMEQEAEAIVRSLEPLTQRLVKMKETQKWHWICLSIALIVGFGALIVAILALIHPW